MRTLILFLLATQVDAKIIEVNYKLHSYKVDYDLEHVNYTSLNVDLSLKKKNCNKHILKSFNIQMKKNLSGDFSNSFFANSYSIEEGGIKKYDSLTSSRGQFFSNFHNYFKQLKIEESLNCDKS